MRVWESLEDGWMWGRVLDIVCFKGYRGGDSLWQELSQALSHLSRIPINSDIGMDRMGWPGRSLLGRLSEVRSRCGPAPKPKLTRETKLFYYCTWSKLKTLKAECRLQPLLSYVFGSLHRYAPTCRRDMSVLKVKNDLLSNYSNDYQ